MIRVRIQIEDNEIYDSADTYGLVYLESDTLFSAPLKPFETSKYPEKDGENVLPKTTYEPFDYTIKFFVRANLGIDNANQKIASFNELLYTEDSEIKTFKRVTFYNDFKKVKIVGYPKLIEKADDFWRDSSGRQADVVCVEWIIRVDKPQECDFNLI